MSTTTAHIFVDSGGVAWVDDSNVKVVEIVLDSLAYGWSAEEICYQHPRLTLAQVHAALSYYYDHQQQLDLELRERQAAVDAVRPMGMSPVRQRLRAQGKI